MKTMYQLIEKEKITELKFPNEDVLSSDLDKKTRFNELQRAMALGNLDQVKYKILFEDDAAIRAVETTIWGVTDHKIILKRGMVIPIHRIHRIM
jgi:hypothetical protein